MTRFLIVVPTRNSARFLGQTLASLLEAQPGDFDLHVRVQDGASTDGTIAVAEAWARRVAAGEVPDAARRRISIASARDAGLYDAVAAAFDAAAADEPEVVTWLGSDDLLLPGALATAANVFGRFPRVRWITGQPQVIDEHGAWYGMGGSQVYARRDLSRGIHDGRGLRFVQHEGTFWRMALYREAGGLRRNLKLAGDFDLWRRFARTDDLVTCAFPLGAWRQRRGQASGDLDAYYREVDRIQAEERGPVEVEAALDDPAMRFRSVLLERDFGGDYAFRDGGLPFRPVDGFGPVEPESGRRARSVPMLAERASMLVPLLEDGVPYRFALRVRGDGAGGRLSVRGGDRTVFDGPLPPTDTPVVVGFTFAPKVKWPLLTLEVSPLPGRGEGSWLARRLGIRRGAPPPALRVEDLAFERRAI